MPKHQLLTYDGLPEVVLNIPLVEQLDASWCWAACLEMLYTYAGQRHPTSGKLWKQADFVAQYLHQPAADPRLPAKAGIGLLNLELLLRRNLRHQDLKLDQGFPRQAFIGQLMDRQLPMLMALERWGKDGVPDHLVLLYGLILAPEPTVLVRDPLQKKHGSGTNLTRLMLNELESEAQTKACYIYNFFA